MDICLITKSILPFSSQIRSLTDKLKFWSSSEKYREEKVLHANGKVDLSTGTRQVKEK